MAKKDTVDKKIIEELTKAVKTLTKTLKNINLNKNTFEQESVSQETKRVSDKVMQE